MALGRRLAMRRLQAQDGSHTPRTAMRAAARRMQGSAVSTCEL
jgi:hypothetical protein